MVRRVPSSTGGISISAHFRNPSVKNAGRDAEGRIIPHVRSEEVAMLVAQLAAGGASLNHIAVRLNLRPGQIKECYALELEHAEEMAGLDVESAALDMARSGQSEAMTKFYLQNRRAERWNKKEEKEGSIFNIHIHD